MKEKNIKITIITIVLMLTLIAVGASAVIVASADVADNRKLTNQYTVAANGEGIDCLRIPCGDCAYVNVIIEEDGYYAMSGLKDESTSTLPIIAIRDEKGYLEHNSDYHEDKSLLCLYLKKGEYEIEIVNTDMDSELNTSFQINSCQQHIDRLSKETAASLTLGSSVNISQGETKVFRLENSKDGYFNYLFAKGQNLSVLVVDNDFENKGYDSCGVTGKDKISQYIQMDPESTDCFYAIFTNDSGEEVALHYISETNFFYYVTDVLVENTPVILECQQEMKTEKGKHFYHSSVRQFTPAQSAYYDFTIITEGECSSYLTVTNAENGEMVIDSSSDFSDRSHCFKGVYLEAGKVYSISASASTTTQKSENKAVLIMNKTS